MDDELLAIRAKRLAQLQASSSSSAIRQSSSPGIPSSSGKSQKDELEEKRQQEESRRSFLAQILTSEARERLSRIQLVKPEKCRSIEDYLLMMAKNGSLRERINEPQLISLLEGVSKKEVETAPKIIVNRRKDDEELNLDEFNI